MSLLPTAPPPGDGHHHPPTQQQKSVAYLKKVWRNSIRKIPSFAGLAPRPSSHDLRLKTDSNGPSASPRWEPTMRKYASVPNLLASSDGADGLKPFRLGQKSLDIVAEEQVEHPPPLPAISPPVLQKQQSSPTTLPDTRVAELEDLISEAQSEAQHLLLPLPGTYIVDTPSVCIETPSPLKPAPIALAESRSYVNARSSSETEVFVLHEEEVSVNEYSYSDDGSYEDIDEIADVLVEQDRDRGRDDHGSYKDIDEIADVLVEQDRDHGRDDDDDSDEDSFLQRALRRQSWRSIYTGAGSIKSTASTPWIDVEDEDPIDAAYERRRKRRSRRARATRSIALVDVERLATEAAAAPQQITNAVPARSPTPPGSDGTFGPSLAVPPNRYSRTLRSLSSREALLRMHRKITLDRVQSAAGESLLLPLTPPPPPPSDVVERRGRGEDGGARDSYMSSFTSRSRLSIIELDSLGQSKRNSRRRGSGVSSRRTRSRSRSRSRSSRRPGGPPSRAGAARLSIQSHSSLLTLYDKILQHYTWTDDMLESNDDDDETASRSGGGTATETSSVATKLDELLGDLADWGRDSSSRNSARRASLRRISRALIAEALREAGEISESGEDIVREDFIENAIDEINHLARSVSAARPSPLPVPPPPRSLSSPATRTASPPPPPTPPQGTSPVIQLPGRAPRSDASGSSPRLSQSTCHSSSSGNGVAITSPTSFTSGGGVVRAQGTIRIARVQHPDGRVTEGDTLVAATEAGYDMDFSYAAKGPATVYLVTIHSEAAVAVPFTWEPALEVWRDDGSDENDQSRGSAPKPTSLFCVTPARGWLPPRGDMVFEVELASTAELVSYDAVATLMLRHLDSRDEASPWASMTDLASRTGTKPCEFLVRCCRAKPTADDTAQMMNPTAVALPRRSLAVSAKRTSIGMGVHLKKQKKNRFKKIFKKISRVVF
ncbi:hypothetical protein HDU87_004379 [Geranomyces variabilis]|uniref:Uncharacterized protein n=1 Tax=Geranomyces variabilis TaxID=109894 RepID=A0AAD5XQR1_9FUNG|nr:hypothetical protein HDU87_004379 [Geranomyces variabilis]